MNRFALAALCAAASTVLFACGSSNNTATGTNDGGGPGSSDAASPDGSSGGDGGNVTPSDAGADAADAGPICYAAGATQSSCRTCCENEHPAGFNIFAQYTVACACAPSLCGPPEAGVPAEGGTGDAGGSDAAAEDAGDAAVDGAAGDDAGAADAGGGDGSIFGQAPCSAATCAYTAAPSAACNTCILDTLGAVSNFGPCGGTVVSQCLGNSDCISYFSCVEKCP